jgi:hypothetical protein
MVHFVCAMEAFMSKHLGNLERLHKKLVVALGDKHPLVLQLQEEIVSFAATVPRRLRRESFSVRPEMGRSFNHRWKYLSSPSEQSRGGVSS